jgi:hypothetical protein
VTGTAIGWNRQVRAAWMLCAGLLGCCWLSAAHAGDIEVLIASERQQMDLDRRQLLSIYIGRLTTWRDGRPIRVFVLPDDNPVHEQFCHEVLGTYPYVLRSAWDKLVYTGTGFAPTVVRDVQDMRRRIESTPGAIGYAPKAAPSDSPQRSNVDSKPHPGGVQP